MAFLLWRGDELHRLSPEQWKMFDAALEDLRFNLSDHFRVHGGAALDSALLTVLDGANVRTVLSKGIGLRIARLRIERNQLSFTLVSNAQLQTYRGDMLSANRLEEMQNEDLVRRQKDVDEIAAEHAFLLSIGVIDNVQDPIGELALAKHRFAERPESLPQDPGHPRDRLEANANATPQFLAPLPPMEVRPSRDFSSAPKIAPMPTVAPPVELPGT
ncbi:MAG TPA: hypothetical protein VGL42_17155 [Opitutaceae bacterium]